MGGGSHAHLRIFRHLPCYGGEVQLHGYKHPAVGQIDHFEDDASLVDHYPQMVME